MGSKLNHWFFDVKILTHLPSYLQKFRRSVQISWVVEVPEVWATNNCNQKSYFVPLVFSRRTVRNEHYETTSQQNCCEEKQIILERNNIRTHENVLLLRAALSFASEVAVVPIGRITLIVIAEALCKRG